MHSSLTAGSTTDRPVAMDRGPLIAGMDRATGANAISGTNTPTPAG